MRKIVLVTQYYSSKLPQRKIEIDTCLKKNLANGEINEFYIMLENESDRGEVEKMISIIPSTQRRIILNMERRIRYKDFFYLTTFLDEDSVAIFCNSDIHYDETIGLFRELKPGHCASLSRYECKDGIRDKLVHEPETSQDSWVVVCPAPDKLIELPDILTGHWHCDGRMVYEFVSAGLIICNPCHEIFSYHLHDGEAATICAGRPNWDINTPGPYRRVNPSPVNHNGLSRVYLKKDKFDQEPCYCTSCRGTLTGSRYSEPFSFEDYL